jgi:Ras-related protein Rab-27A
MGFLLVFDLTNESSFLNVRNWIGEIQANAYSENVNIILVGNKSDLESERIITKVRAIEFAKQNHIDYIETSALNNINVTESIKLLLDSVMDRLEQNPSLSQLKVNSVKILSEQMNQEYSENPSKLQSNQSFCCSY